MIISAVKAQKFSAQETTQKVFTIPQTLFTFPRNTEYPPERVQKIDNYIKDLQKKYDYIITPFDFWYVYELDKLGYNVLILKPDKSEVSDMIDDYIKSGKDPFLNLDIGSNEDKYLNICEAVVPLYKYLLSSHIGKFTYNDLPLSTVKEVSYLNPIVDYL